MPDSPHTCTVEVRYADLDPLGHVNNAVYFSYIEVGRIKFFQQLLGQIEMDPGFVVASARCDFRTPAYFGERLTVETRVTRLGNRSFDLAHRVVGPDGRLVAEAQTVQVAVGPDGKSRPLPDLWRERLGAALAGTTP